MRNVLRETGGLLWQTVQEFLADGCMRMAAAISFYTVFSLPGLLILTLAIVGLVVDPQAAADLLHGEIGELLGPEGAEQVRVMLSAGLEVSVGGNPVRVGLGIVTFLFGATGAFVQLQVALDVAWGVEPDPTRGDVGNFLLKRVLSFAMILVVGFLLLVSLAVSAVLAGLGDAVERILPAGLGTTVLTWTNGGLTLLLVTALCATMYRVFPDARIGWRTTIGGALLTALLFTGGKQAIGFYLGRSDPGSAFGAAGSLALVLLWIYYSAIIFLFGAELTQVWRQRRGYPIEPEPGAVRVVITKERVER